MGISGRSRRKSRADLGVNLAQVATQVIGAALNAAQFYLLQYLPAKRKEEKDERMRPRGPLF